LPHDEFYYNNVIHNTTNYSPSKIIYGFNPSTPLDLLPMSNISMLKHQEA